MSAARPGPTFVFFTTLKIICACHVFMEYVGFYRNTAGPSMLPTLEQSKDALWISSQYRRGRAVRVGDMVSYRHPEAPGEGACKRVLGMPGDFVRIDSPGMNPDGWNDRKGPLAALRADLDKAGREFGGKGGLDVRNWTGRYIQVPEGHCWLEGDNAPWSKDSRDYGPIPLALIKGKVLARVNPVSRMKWIENGLRDTE